MKNKWESETFRYWVYGIITSLIIAVVILIIQLNIPVRISEEDHQRITLEVKNGLLEANNQLLTSTDELMSGISCSHNLSKIYGSFRWNQVYPFIKDKINLTNLESYNNPDIPYPYPFSMIIFNGGNNNLVEPIISIKYDRVDLLYQVYVINENLADNTFSILRTIPHIKKSNYESEVFLDDLKQNEKIKLAFLFLPDLNHDCNKILNITFEVKDRFNRVSNISIQKIPIIDVEP